MLTMGFVPKVLQRIPEMRYNLLLQNHQQIPVETDDASLHELCARLNADEDGWFPVTMQLDAGRQVRSMFRNKQVIGVLDGKPLDTPQIARVGSIPGVTGQNGNPFNPGRRG